MFVLTKNSSAHLLEKVAILRVLLSSLVRKQDIDDNLCLSRPSFSSCGFTGQFLKVVDYNVEDIDNEHFNNPQSIWNIDYGTYYQFDNIQH